MIVLHETLLIVRVEVKHLAEQVASALARTVRPESYVRHCLCFDGGLHVVTCRVSLIRAHLPHGEVLRSSVDESRKLRRVSRVAVCYLDGCNDIRFYARADVNLNPVPTV